jgi:hypothetical protein
MKIHAGMQRKAACSLADAEARGGRFAQHNTLARNKKLINLHVGGNTDLKHDGYRNHY